MTQTFRAQGSTVFLNPETTTREDGSKSISLGAPICEVNEYIENPEETAKWIAEKLSVRQNQNNGGSNE